MDFIFKCNFILGNLRILVLLLEYGGIAISFLSWNYFQYEFFFKASLMQMRCLKFIGCVTLELYADIINRKNSPFSLILNEIVIFWSEHYSLMFLGYAFQIPSSSFSWYWLLRFPGIFLCGYWWKEATHFLFDFFFTNCRSKKQDFAEILILIMMEIYALCFKF